MTVYLLLYFRPKLWVKNFAYFKYGIRTTFLIRRIQSIWFRDFFGENIAREWNVVIGHEWPRLCGNFGICRRSSAGLTIWQKRHMPRAPRFWGPRACSLVFFTEVFVPCFSAGPKQCASAGPQRAQVPQKTRGPRKLGPNGFFLFPVLVFQRGAPKSPRSSETL
jgi:hypothetical protein